MKKEEVLELVANGENSGVEFKRDDIRPEQLAKEIVALANLQGGYILLGVEDDGTIRGVSRPKLGEWVSETVFGRYVHPIILPYYEEVRMDRGKRVAVVSIGREISKPYVVRAKGRELAYVRIGAVSRPATREQLLMFGAAGGAVHVEAMPVNRTDFDFLDLARLDNYLRDILKDPEVPSSRDSWIGRLKMLGFMTEGVGGTPVCTIAGLVLFGIRPRQVLKQAGVRMMFFDALDKQYRALLDKVIDGPLVGRFRVGKAGKDLIDPGLIEKSLETMEPFITREPNEIDENFRRPKKWLYPRDAIRELLINALAHRDWTRFVDVEVSGYQDRLEIISPGALPNSMTVEKMLAGQRSARNTILAEVLRDYGYVDARGMGVRTKVVPALRAGGLRARFDATEDYLKTVVGGKSGQKAEGADFLSVKTPSGDGDVPQKAAGNVGETPDMSEKRPGIGGKTPVKMVALMRDDPNVTISEMAKAIGVAERTVERNLRKLQENGVVRRVGPAKGGYWEVLVG